jgi:hypothetical protein
MTTTSFNGFSLVLVVVTVAWLLRWRKGGTR